MKTVKFFLGALALAAVSMAVAPAASAQENGNKDENGKVVRGPYLTNKFGDNWFVGVAGGVNIYGDGGYTPAVAPALDVNVGKWFTPSVGARLGYNGLSGAEWSKTSSVLGTSLDSSKGMYKQKFGAAYVHADVLWNVSNALGGYKETRFWNFIPYFHSGWHMTYAKPSYKNQEFAAGFGLLNNLRLCDRLDLTLDVRGVLLNGNHHAAKGGVAGYVTTSLGLSVNLGKTNWVRASNWHNPADEARVSAAEASAAALAAANAGLAADKKNLANEVNALKSENSDLKSKLNNVKTGLENVGPAAFFFEIGKTQLSKKELEHLDFYLSNVLPNVTGKKVTVLTGRADSKTGTAKRNKYLSEKRVEYLKNILVEKYGINASNFEVKTEIVSDGDAALGRAAVISFE